MSETLLPCPFCGGEAALVPTFDTTVREWFVTCGNLECSVLACRTKRYYTEAEAIAAWNTRAAMEFDNWFYLPKPKEGIVQYGEPQVVEAGEGRYKMLQGVDVIESAIRSWGDELGEYVMQRICETWNTRSAGTCEIVEYDEAPFPVCSECGAVQPDDFTVYYCWNCGCKVVDA